MSEISHCDTRELTSCATLEIFLCTPPFLHLVCKQHRDCIPSPSQDADRCYQKKPIILDSGYIRGGLFSKCPADRDMGVTCRHTWTEPALPGDALKAWDFCAKGAVEKAPAWQWLGVREGENHSYQKKTACAKNRAPEPFSKSCNAHTTHVNPSLWSARCSPLQLARKSWIKTNRTLIIHSPGWSILPACSASQLLGKHGAREGSGFWAAQVRAEWKCRGCNLGRAPSFVLPMADSSWEVASTRLGALLAALWHCSFTRGRWCVCFCPGSLL